MTHNDLHSDFGPYQLDPGKRILVKTNLSSSARTKTDALWPCGNASTPKLRRVSKRVGARIDGLDRMKRIKSHKTYEQQ